MPTSGARSGFSLYDLLTRVIPGTVVLSPFLVVFTFSTDPSTPTIEIDPIALMLVLTIVAFIVGEVLDQLRITVFTVPTSFRQALHHETDRNDVLGFLDRVDRKLQWAYASVPTGLRSLRPSSNGGGTTIFSNTNQNLTIMFEDHLGLNPEVVPPYDLYSALISYMEPRLSGRTRRYQTLRTFSLNFILAALLTSGVTAVIAAYEQTTVWLATLLVVVVFVLPFTLFLVLVLSYSGRLFIDTMIIEYYVDRVSQTRG